MAKRQAPVLFRYLERALALSLCVSLGISVGIAASWGLIARAEVIHLEPLEKKAQTISKSKGDGDEPLTMMELEPELDPGQTDEPQKNKPSAVTDEQPLKAKAVVIDINSKTLTYDKDRDAYIATGNVHVVISEQNSELYADQIVYDQNQSLLIAEGHVNIYKNGEKTIGSYAKIDLTRNSALINDVVTSINEVRVKAQQSMLGSNSMIFENGRLIIKQAALGKVIANRKARMIADNVGPVNKDKKQIPPKGHIKKDDASYDPFNDGSLSHLALNDPFASSLDSRDRTLSSETVDLSTVDTETVDQQDFLHFKAHQIDVYRWKDGYTKFDAKNPAIYAGKFKLATDFNTQFSSDIMTKEREYLGPDMGFDPNYGGFYYGPGYDFRLGNGSVRFSPLVTYGGGYRRARGGTLGTDQSLGAGVGAVMHYRGDDSRIDLAYTTKVGEPILYAEKMLFDKKTRLIATANKDYINGFMGFERPKYGTMISDYRRLGDWNNARLDVFTSAGYFKDEFFPTNQSTYFVKPTSSSPLSAGRIQLQAQISNKRPIFSIGDFLYFGASAQLAMAGYTNGSMVGVLRGGPSVSYNYRKIFRSSLRYYYAKVSGRTPFTFDTYYQGRESVGWSNAVKINNVLTVGTGTTFSLKRDNAKHALVTGNQVFALIGPRTLKVNLAYDVINRRSYFGLVFIPGKDGQTIDYDKMNVFSPDQYLPPVSSSMGMSGGMPGGMSNMPMGAPMQPQGMAP